MNETTAIAAAETRARNGSVALSALKGIRGITAASDRVYRAMGYVCGAQLLLLGLFITYQVNSP